MLKNGVDLRGLTPQMAIAYTIASRIYNTRGYECVITSGSDGKHMPTSLHYQGKALDLRTRDLQEQTKVAIVEKLKEALGEQFDVVLEGDHCHLEFDPKEKKVLAEER